jgi:hypothetical protein
MLQPLRADPAKVTQGVDRMWIYSTSIWNKALPLYT